MDFYEYRLTSDALCMGERMKAGIFRPCIKTIPYSQITGALQAKFGRDKKIHAVGCLVENSYLNQKEYYIYSPRDKVMGKSKVPLQMEYLTDVVGRVFILRNEDTHESENDFEIYMGALKSKGFGKCHLVKTRIWKEGEYKPKKFEGVLNVRIPLNKIENFGFSEKDIKSRVYGYLFEPPDPPILYGGQYVLSLFEGSEVVCPEFLKKE
ncbi:MAG: hypothetical protein WCE90_06595 [Candidatus Zixiibacteriota bacterium]